MLLQDLARIARLSGTAVQCEPHLALGAEGNRTDGIFFFLSIPTHIDVTVIHPATSSYAKKYPRPLAAVKKREQEKRQLYLHAAQTQGALFFPVIIESFGTFGPGSISFISRLAEEATNSGINSIEDQPIKGFICRSLSFTLMKGNANILLSGSRSSRSRLNIGQF
jgi:hypothetical protein